MTKIMKSAKHGDVNIKKKKSLSLLGNVCIFYRYICITPEGQTFHKQGQSVVVVNSAPMICNGELHTTRARKC